MNHTANGWLVEERGGRTDPSEGGGGRREGGEGEGGEEGGRGEDV